MEFIGRIAQVFDVKTGLKQDKSEWKSQEFIFEYFENENDRYSDKVVLKVMNDRINEYQLQQGMNVRIGFGHHVREWNGAYYNDLRIYKFENLDRKTEDKKDEDKKSATEPLPVEPRETEKDDLPF